VTRLAKQTGLTVAQVYKWGWDQRNKLFKRLKTSGNLDARETQNIIRSHTDEWGGYSKPHWSALQQMNSEPVHQPLLDLKDDESLCKLVGIDIEKKIKELLEQDRLEKEQSKKKEISSLPVPSLNKD
jgi:hypothetical protein